MVSVVAFHPANPGSILGRGEMFGVEPQQMLFAQSCVLNKLICAFYAYPSWHISYDAMLIKKSILWFKC